jgi:hypothetical protein
MKGNTNSKDLVLLVTNKKNSLFGQIAKIDLHDYRDSGNYFVTFSDGRTERFYDGNEKGNPKPEVKVFYRHNNEQGKIFDTEENFGPKSLKKTFLDLNVGNLNVLSERYKKLFKQNL